jgi:hypothetical protein
LNSVRQFWRLSALPGAHSCIGLSRYRERSLDYRSSSTFQYASLTNFAQLSMRRGCAA